VRKLAVVLAIAVVWNLAFANKNLRKYPSCVQVISNYVEPARKELPTITLGQLSDANHVLNPRRVAQPDIIQRLPETFPQNDRTDVVNILKPDPHLYAQAYDFGIFPWREVVPGEVTWHSPEQRGIIRLEKPIKIGDTLRKFLLSNVEKNNMRYVLSLNRDFDRVVSEIANMDRNNRPGQSQAWFHKSIEEAYRTMHSLGRVHSIEVYDSVNNELVAGMIATVANGYIAGESMFHRKIVENGVVVSEVNDAGKMAGVALLVLAKLNGFKFVDTQTMKPGTFQSQSGGELIPREEFLGMLQEAQQNPPVFKVPEGFFTIYFEKYTPEEVKADNQQAHMIGQPNKKKPILIEVVR